MEKILHNYELVLLSPAEITEDILGASFAKLTETIETFGGSLLIKDSLKQAENLGHSRVLLIGDLPYYSRLGFKKLSNVKMPQPTNPERVLGIELVFGAWDILGGSVESFG